jgi:glucan 1,3-beta-glucosidase
MGTAVVPWKLQSAHEAVSVNQGIRYEGTFPGSTQVYGNCSTWTDYTTFSPEMKGYLLSMSQAYMDATRNWAFWSA